MAAETNVLIQTDMNNWILNRYNNEHSPMMSVKQYWTDMVTLCESQVFSKHQNNKTEAIKWQKVNFSLKGVSNEYTPENNLNLCSDYKKGKAKIDP